MKDWKQKHANDAEKAFEHRLVKDVEAEYVENMQGFGVDLSEGLPRYGLHKVMTYVAQVARAQALGFDPELLALTDKEATAEQMKLARIAVEAGKPVIIVGDLGEPVEG